MRYIYLRPTEEYLRIDPHRDTIEGPLDETLDFSGWDLRKALSLMRKSNPSLLEWNGSPIVYRTTEAWGALAREISACYDPRSNLCHYLSMAKGNIKKFLMGDRVSVKKYLYVLRAILCCRWVLLHHTAPPVFFADLCRAVLPPALAPVVADLLQQKQGSGEAQTCCHIPALDELIDSERQRVEAALTTLPRIPPADCKTLNALFLCTLRSVW